MNIRVGFLFVGIALLAASYTANAQADTTKRSFSDATYWGGGFNIRFGNITDLSASPRLGYFIDKNKRISAGAGLTYRYFSNNLLGFNTSFYGYSLFQRNRVVEGFFTHAEYQRMSVPLAPGGVIQDVDNVPRVWVPALLLGGGYALEVGDGVYLMATALYEVTNDPNNFYPKRAPIVSVSINRGFW